MTRRTISDPDAITVQQAANLLALSPMRVARLRREGLLVRLQGFPSYSRADVQQFIDNPWLNGVQVAQILGVGRARVSQLAVEERIPVHTTAAGRRIYRLEQIEVVARARKARDAGCTNLVTESEI